MLPKEGKDLNEVQNYQPIKLLNVDYKIYAAILANRLKGLLPCIIYQDQNEFVYGRQLKNNIRILMNAIEVYHQCPGEQAAFVFLDAEKAFNNVKWRCIIEQFSYMECGDVFLHLVLEVYCQQYTRIFVSEDMTNLLKIGKDSRQGCLLFPLLFILALEPLLIQLRNNNDIKGLKIRKQEYKI